MRKVRKDKGCGRHPYKSGPGLTKDTRKKIIENNIGETIENERLFSTFGILEKFIYEFSPEGIIMMKGVTYDGMDEFVFMPKTIVSEAKEDSIIRNNLKKFKYDADNNLQNPEHKVYRAVIGKKVDPDESTEESEDSEDEESEESETPKDGESKESEDLKDEELEES